MSEETTTATEPKIPRPETVAAMIQANLDRLDAVKTETKEDNAVLRRQLKFSCEYYGVEYHDPSARKKVAT